jgi:hypothetical protein
VRLKILFTSNDTSKQIVGHNGEIIYSAEIKLDSKGNTNIGIRTTAQAFAPGYISATKTSLSSSSMSCLTVVVVAVIRLLLVVIVIRLLSITTFQATLRKIYSETFKRDLNKMVLIFLLVNSGS